MASDARCRADPGRVAWRADEAGIDAFNVVGYPWGGVA
jgi:hypothetical protein